MLSLDELSSFMSLVTYDLNTFTWPFIETIIATKDFDSEAEESMKQYILDTVEYIQQ